MIQRSMSNWNSPIYLIRKKKNLPDSMNNLRFILDLRQVNSQMEVPQMTMNSGFGAIQTIREATAKIFSNLDLQQAFHQLKLKDNKSRKATSFTVRAGNALMENGVSPNGKWEMLVCSMGSAASSHALDRAVHKTFEGLGNVSTFADDIAVFSHSMNSHLKQLEEVLDRIIKYGWLLNPGKSTFATNEIDFLGFTISQKEVKPDNDLE